ncbi:unnamed protein product, partial [Ostreobium quekettii]
GNPCCEEPDYRLAVINEMPSLEIFDEHVVTIQEKERAKALIAADVASLAVAFGRRAPQYDLLWGEKVPKVSPLERDAGK